MCDSAPSHSSVGADADGVHGKLFMPESFFNECAIVRIVFNAPITQGPVARC